MCGQSIFQSRGSGKLAEMTAFAEQCMNDYDERGWRVEGYAGPQSGGAE